MDNRIYGDPGTSAFRVEKYPFYLLNRLVGRYNGIIEPRLRAIGLDIPNWRVLCQRRRKIRPCGGARVSHERRAQESVGRA